MDEVASNKSYLDDRMNSIKNTANDGITGITIASTDYTSTTRIPSSEPEIENNLLNGIKLLFENIVKEVDAIKEVGVDFQDMDNFLEGVSTSLGFDLMSKDEPIVDLVDYSSMQFDDLLNANIPSVPDSYSGNGGYDGGYSGGNYGGNNSSGYNSPGYSSDAYTPYSGEDTGRDGTYTYIKPSVTMPTLSTPTRTVKLSSTSTPSTSTTRDYDPLGGTSYTTKTKTNEPEVQRISATKTEDSTPIVTKLSSTKNGSGGRISSRYGGYNGGLNTDSTVEDDIVSGELLGNELEPSAPEDYNENINIGIREEVPEETVATPAKEEEDKSKTLKSLGIAAGVGLVSGAVGLATHKMLKDKEDYEDEDYGYESEGDF